LQRTDALGLTLRDGSFTAILAYSFSATTGADCEDQLASSGGQYQTLPCTVSYDLTGARQ
ncbi:MAG: hypothetical protein ACRELB_04435, partial [Polyangiaceae bacterium]